MMTSIHELSPRLLARVPPLGGRCHRCSVSPEQGTPPMTDDLRAQLAQQIHRVDWKPLAPHAKRGGLVMVDSQLDLLEVAVAVAQDDGEQVQQWMAEQQLNRPTADQAEAWRTETGERFTTVIVQPYVLAQRDDGAPSGG